MSDVVDGGAAVAAAREVGYVVQVKLRARPEGWDGQPVEVWRDVAVVRVPRRTKRRTVIERALASTEVDTSDGAVLRVLSPDDARVFMVSSVPRDPELRIEGA